MKGVKVMLHIIPSLAAAFLLVGLPTLYILDMSKGKDTDAVSGASIRLPDKPSGDYVILLNSSLHEDCLDDWTAFFSSGELNVIFDDISVIAAQSDTAAVQMAERFRAQLPENQMSLRTENPTLLVSKAESGCIDAAIFSKEMADSLRLSDKTADNIIRISVKGGEEKK